MTEHKEISEICNELSKEMKARQTNPHFNLQSVKHIISKKKKTSYGVSTVPTSV